MAIESNPSHKKDAQSASPKVDRIEDAQPRLHFILLDAYASVERFINNPTAETEVSGVLAAEQLLGEVQKLASTWREAERLEAGGIVFLKTPRSVSTT